jgi:hypothetical protein
MLNIFIRTNIARKPGRKERKKGKNPIWFYSLVKYSRILKATNSSASGITTYIGLYPNRLIIIGYTCCGGGDAMISNSNIARDKLCNRSAIVNIISPSVKLDLILLYI